VKRLAVVALALLTACSGSPNQRPKTKAHATTTVASTSTTTSTTAVTATTTSLALAKPCAGADFGVGEIQSDGASQHVLTSVALLNTSAYTCSLSGFPTTLTAIDQDGHPLEHFDQGAYQPDPPAGDVAPGQSGVVIIDTKTVCDPTPAPRNFKNVQLGLPGGGTVSLGDFVINGMCGVAVSKLGVRK
jgi:hypothetical protein